MWTECWVYRRNKMDLRYKQRHNGKNLPNKQQQTNKTRPTTNKQTNKNKKQKQQQQQKDKRGQGRYTPIPSVPSRLPACLSSNNTASTNTGRLDRTGESFSWVTCKWIGVDSLQVNYSLAKTRTRARMASIRSDQSRAERCWWRRQAQFQKGARIFTMGTWVLRPQFMQ